MLHGINRAGGGTLTESWTFGATQPAIVNKNNGKRKSDFVYVILRLSEALVCFRASGDNFLRSITRAHFGIMLGPFWDNFGIIWDHVGIILGSFWNNLRKTLGSLWEHVGIIVAYLVENAIIIFP